MKALSPDGIKTIGFWILMAGLFGDILILFMPANRRTLEKALAVLFTVVIIVGVGLEKLGDHMLDQRNGPRHLSKIQFNELVAELKPFAGQSYSIVRYTDEREVSQLSNSLQAGLDIAGWKYREPTFGEGFIGTNVGVVIAVHGANDPAGTAALSLIKFLNTKTFVAAIGAAENNQLPNNVIIHIGTRVRWD